MDKTSLIKPVLANFLRNKLESSVINTSSLSIQRVATATWHELAR